MDEIRQSESVQPNPKPAPSKTDAKGLFLYAKDSARYMMIQLTTMSGINIPSDAFNSGGKYAFMSSSTIVTNAAITTIKHGIRISRGIYDRTMEIIKLEQTSTKVAAPPIASPFFTEVVTARLGQIPNTSTNIGLYSSIPLVNSFRLFCSAIA